ncbi:hypothetical protein T4B_74 [Trichinella pseudospiralis]|uniref:Uncharacterized protein n=2 Tax=Trichinella pseudospiralis TaxID=6337 RepID=A0A0V1FW84_TRIPS|nr:hypothetical protein T4E_7418 [Trichinella pseudospiralis]KRY90279.1 hypothetical protein T4D_11053 [Trichinella pseudospiralis]KRZ33594.1 hypothetical protein T4B_74 [Trichinella pseudospiralis]
MLIYLFMLCGSDGDHFLAGKKRKERNVRLLLVDRDIKCEQKRNREFVMLLTNTFTLNPDARPALAVG